MYIVAGILMSNEEICDTVDRIQIAPRVEVKPEIEASKPSKAKQQRALTAAGAGAGAGDTSVSRPRKRIGVIALASRIVRRATSRITRRLTWPWMHKYDVRLVLKQWRTMSHAFDMWTIPNYLIEYTSSYISKKFFINSDCDMIYK
ncbi:uncharacterized protein LOC115632172 isoform X2 [Scaptodrosophila lebanonensis]|nr:uncharacterized protein LOC115632172 isoform X2 [Scaptodrosophila lebanonensis]XP_030385063.1 uncharacterized protein LOC115632172 isoform X2 [Scaptodrosophila lebanonensis]